MSGDLTPEEYQTLFGEPPPVVAEPIDSPTPHVKAKVPMLAPPIELDGPPLSPRRSATIYRAVRAGGLALAALVGLGMVANNMARDPIASTPETAGQASTPTSTTEVVAVEVAGAQQVQQVEQDSNDDEAMSSQIEILHCDAEGETVELINQGDEFLTLVGWVLHDGVQLHEAQLDQIGLAPDQRIVLLSGIESIDAPGTFRWDDGNVWNEGDIAILRRGGTVVSKKTCTA